jgi:deoxyribodipyrimidine photo-lyase
MRALVWFRSDLRVDDNPALLHACRSADEGVVGGFTICPRQWLEEHDWADIKVDFLLRNLRELADRLETLNIPLKIIETPDFSGVPRKLLALADECKCDRLYFNHEYEWNESRRDERVAEVFEEAGRTVHAFHGSVLFAPGRIRTKGDGSFYEVYSPFKRACWAAYHEGEYPEVLPKPGKAGEIGVKPDAIPGSVKGFDTSPPGTDLWPAGEKAAKLRLSNFIQHRVESYKERRDFPAEDATSALSPYLNLGVLSPGQCMAPALELNGWKIDKGNKNVIAWMEEILWRDFYKHILVGFPRVSQGRAFRLEYERVTWREDPEALAAWKEGRTGYPLVDAAMRSLTAQGWMHNRLRMVVAMFLSKHLLIDWREGERHFMRHLVDGDLGSNNGGWQWSASTGTDAQPYFRIFNPVTQSKRFDPDGAFIRRWAPELESLDAKLIHEPSASPIAMQGLDYPEPIVDQKEGRERAIETFEKVRGRG